MVENGRNSSTEDREWRDYWDRTEGRPPRPTLLRAVDALQEERSIAGRPAVDLGCGTGRDTVELVQRGFTVTAVDAERAALARLGAKLPEARIELVHARLEVFAPPPALLVNASFCLFLLPPAALRGLWSRIGLAIFPGGRFAGQLLGPEDSWARSGRATAVTAAELDELYEGWEVEHLEEERTAGTTPRGERKQWHIWHLVLRRRA